MTVFVCIDKNGGMMFNNRRQSRDREVISDIMLMTGGKLKCDDYSLSLFNNITPDPENVFIENKSVKQYLDKITRLVIYNWNKVYPSDFGLDIDPEKDGFTLDSTQKLKGFSHENIIKEIWMK